MAARTAGRTTARADCDAVGRLTFLPMRKSAAAATTIETPTSCQPSRLAPEPEQPSALVDDERGHVGERRLVGEHEAPATPRARLAAHDGQRAACTDTRARRTPSARRRSAASSAASRRRVSPAQRLAQRLVLLVGAVDVEHDPHRRDEDLARGERAEDADADPPVEAQRRERRLDEAAEHGRRCCCAVGRRAPGRRARRDAGVAFRAGAPVCSMARALARDVRADGLDPAGTTAPPRR